MGLDHISMDPTAVDTTQFAATGTRIRHLDPTYGEQEYVFVYNDSGATLSKYRFCKFKSGSSLSVLVTADGDQNSFVAGVPQVDIADGEYGWALRKGDGLVQSDAAVAANVPLVLESSGTSVAGRVDDTAVTTVALLFSVVAHSVAAASAAAENFRARILLP